MHFNIDIGCSMTVDLTDLIVLLWILLVLVAVLAGSAMRFRVRCVERTWFGIIGVKTSRDLVMFISVLGIGLFIIAVLCLSLGGIVSWPLMA